MDGESEVGDERLDRRVNLKTNLKKKEIEMLGVKYPEMFLGGLNVKNV